MRKITSVRFGLTSVPSGVYKLSMHPKSFVCIIFLGFFIRVDFFRGKN